MVQSIENDNISHNQCGSIYHSGITSVTNKAITTVTKHLSQKQQLVIKNGVITSDTTPKIGNNICHQQKIWQYGKIIYKQQKKQ